MSESVISVPENKRNGPGKVLVHVCLGCKALCGLDLDVAKWNISRTKLIAAPGGQSSSTLHVKDGNRHEVRIALPSVDDDAVIAATEACAVNGDGDCGAGLRQLTDVAPPAQQSAPPSFRPYVAPPVRGIEVVDALGQLPADS